MPGHSFQPNKNLPQHSTAHHGAINYKEMASLGLDPNNILDFSTNVNPYGPPTIIREIISVINPSPYPDRDSIVIRKVLSKQHDLDINQILAGNGTAELIWMINFSFLNQGDKVLILDPTFGEYQRCASLMGAEVHFLTASPVNNFALEIEKLEQSLHNLKPKLCFI
ncbi:MAG: aminotransferase class I/II-fold pyridoxal phosphate-dependent enzyme, partial [Anaerolineaceae bacterium]|nr:aminotransferase class I/II-fold pyridoxal phosphate-dependent enzyme [Anaerolineaceae bacterium]